ncbi:AraC family transcriptional regulator [Paenibacillus sp. J5C_2022]|uniref:helix-turn-helix domain-containing protein n=1 Tax=Paenibacillus sp. J5C2022 TaxID=2977129 RepID=UPI0021CFAE7A|nr:AraC family transcriptional regulator [Paenibacillus sp. J5C2022]MCU6710595.1 AraC family transcriptional regulator [Paenibacillus sp. J5C2022]
MRKNWFYKLLLSYLPVFFVISLSLLFITYLTINELSKKSAVKSNEALTGNITKMIDHTLGGIDAALLNELQNNARIIAFFDVASPSDRQYANIQAVSAIKELMSTNSLIDSVYLYNTPDRTVVTASTATTLEAFPDRELLGSLVNSKEPFRWMARRLPQGMGVAGEEKSVVSLVKYTNLFDFSLIVVNVDTNRLQELIESMSDKETTFVELRDRNSGLISSNSAGSESAASSSKRHGKVIAESVSPYTGWTVHSGSRNGAVAELISSLFYVWIALGFALIVSGIVWILYVTKRNYRPIQLIAERIAGSVPKPEATMPQTMTDEIQFISATIENLLDESSLLQERDRKNLVYRKRHLFLTLMDEAASQRRMDWKQELLHAGITIPVASARVAIIEIDRYSDFVKQYNRDYHLLKDVLSSVTLEIFEDRPYTIWTEWTSKNQLALLFLYDDPERGAEETEYYCEKLRAWVSDNLDFTVTIGIGKSVEGIAWTYESFRSAMHTVAFKSSLGDNRILMPEDTSSKPKGEVFRQLQSIRSFCQAFRAGDSAWEMYIDDLHGSLKEQLYAREDLFNLMNVLVDHLQKEMNELPDELRAVWEEDVYIELKEVLRCQETLGPMFGQIRSILRRTHARMAEQRDNKSSHQLVQNMKAYIDAHYDNEDLSLTHLGDVFGLSAKYLGRLFREDSGVKFVEYVTEVRIEEAKRLLLESDEPVQHIAARVGYSQALTFIRVFKKQTGLTPGQFRKTQE